MFTDSCSLERTGSVKHSRATRAKPTAGNSLLSPSAYPQPPTTSSKEQMDIRAYRPDIKPTEVDVSVSVTGKNTPELGRPSTVSATYSPNKRAVQIFQRRSAASSVAGPSAKQATNIFDDVKGKARPQWKVKTAELLDSLPAIFLMVFFVLLSLFYIDFRDAALPASVDKAYQSVTTICIVYFGTELMLGSLSRENYVFTFYFYVDVVATISLLFDFAFFVDILTGSNSTAVNQTSITRASRASQLGGCQGLGPKFAQQVDCCSNLQHRL